jgi:hypothetical protein
MGHSDVLLVLLSPRSSSERFGAGARPVHPIRVEFDSGLICPKLKDERTCITCQIDANDPEWSCRLATPDNGYTLLRVIIKSQSEPRSAR